MKYVDAGVQTLLLILIATSLFFDRDSFIVLIPFFVWPWQLVSAIVGRFLTSISLSTRRLYLSFSLGYLLGIFPILTAKDIVSAAIDADQLFAVPIFLTLIYYGLTVISVIKLTNQ